MQYLAELAASIDDANIKGIPFASIWIIINYSSAGKYGDCKFSFVLYSTNMPNPHTPITYYVLAKY